MKWTNIATIYKKELRDMLRDRRAVISMLVVPALVVPVLIFSLARIGAKVTTQAHEEIPVVMVIEGADSPGVVQTLKSAEKFKVVPSVDNWQEQISEKKIRAAVRIPPGFESTLQTESSTSVTIYNYQGEIKSEFAANELDHFFRDLRDRTVQARLRQHSLSATLIRPFEIDRKNVAPPEKVGGNLMGGFLPYLVILFCLTGAMYPAMDLTAGEKERGTMETLLCTPTARTEIVLGKFLMVLTGSVSAIVLSLVSMGVSMGMLASSLSGAVGKAAGTQGLLGGLPTLSPLGLVGVMLLILPVAVSISAVVFALALFAKSYKEAQTYIAPLVIFVILPAAIGMMPGIELNTRMALTPILGLSLVCKEMLSGVWHWQYIGIVWVSYCCYAALALILAVRMFMRESVIFRT